MTNIFSPTDARMFKYVLIIVMLVLMETIGFAVFSVYSDVRACEVKYNEPCSIIAIPTSIKDLTDDK